MTETGSIVCTRAGVEVAAAVDWGGNGPLARLSRLGLEIAGRYPGTGGSVDARVSRLGLEIAGDAPPSPLNITRLGVEVAAESPPAKLLATRLGVEVAAEVAKPPFRLTRLGLEVSAARPGVLYEEDEPVVLPFYVHNWAHEMEIETTFQTAVSQEPSGGGRERMSRLSKPLRIISPHWNPGIAQQGRELLWDLLRLGNDRLLIPLYPDKQRVSANSSGTFLFCNPRLRRFFARSRVIIYQRSQMTATVSNVQSRVISSVTDTGLVLTQAMSGSPTPLDWYVVPAMYCEISLEEDIDYLTDGVADYAPSFVEAEGATSLRMLEDGDGRDFPTHLGRAVLHKEVNWATPPTLGMRRQGESSAQGKGTAVSLRGTRPELMQELSIVGQDREESWSILKFLESRRGRTRSFWVPVPVPICANSNIISISTTEIELTETPRILNLQDFLFAIAIRTMSGDLHIARVDQVAQDIGSWTISLLDALPTDLEAANVRKLLPCLLSSLASDSFTETWHTDGVASFSFSCVDMPIEEDVATPSLLGENSHTEPVLHIALTAFEHVS